MRSIITALEVPSLTTPAADADQPMNMAAGAAGASHSNTALKEVRKLAALACALPPNPRLHHVLTQLRMQERRLKRDLRQGHLSIDAFKLLRKQKHSISLSALKIAAHHRGKLPLESFSALQTAINEFNVNVRRMLPT